MASKTTADVRARQFERYARMTPDERVRLAALEAAGAVVDAPSA